MHGRHWYTGQLFIIGQCSLHCSLFGEASSDPYCELSIGTVITHETRRTRHIANTLNPVWDEQLTLPVYRPYSTLTIKVFDYDKFSKDDHIGMVPLLHAVRLNAQ